MSDLTIDVKNEAMLGTMGDGVVAAKLYSLEKALEEKDKEIARLKSKYVYVPKIDHSKEIYALRGMIFRAIERLQDYDLVEDKNKVINDVFDILRKVPNEE